MDEWLRPIRCYLSPAGRNTIADWYNGLSAQEQAYADEFIKNMRRIREWGMPHYRLALRGGEGLGELRWKSHKKQHRLIGFFAGGTWFAVMGCTHKQGIYNPPEALAIAKKRKKQIEHQEAMTAEYDL